MKHFVPLTLVFVYLLTCNLFGQSQKLQDFQAAIKENRGCDTIPYSDLRSICKSQGDQVHDWCDSNRGPVSCSKGETAKLVEATVREYKTLESLKSNRHDLDDKRYHASSDDEKSKFQTQIDDVDKKIDQSNRNIETLKRSTDARKDLVQKTMDTIDKCMNYRQAVLNIFKDTIDKVRSEDAPEIRPLAQTLKGKYQDEKDGHEKAISDKNNAKENCRGELP